MASKFFTTSSGEVFMFAFVYFLLALLAYGQSNGGVKLTELNPSFYQQEEVYGVYANTTETFLVLKRDGGGGRILYKKTGAEWADVDLKDIKGTLFKSDLVSDASISPRLTVIGRSFYSINSDGLYFTTAGSFVGNCGGSYRIKKGKVEPIVVNDTDLTYKGLDGKTLTKKALCATVAFPLGDDDVVLEVKPIGVLRKQGAVFTQLFETLVAAPPPDITLPYPYTFGQSIGDLGVWGNKNGLYFARAFDLGLPVTISYFDFSSKKFTDLYKTTMFNGLPVTSWSYANDPLTNERYFRLTTNDGKHHLVTITKEKGVEEIFNTSSTYPGFTGPTNKIALWGSISRQMALFGIMPDKTYDGIGIWRGDPVGTEVLLQKGQTLPSGKAIELHNINPLNAAPLAVVGCTGLVPVYQTGGIKLNTLLEVKTPCITEYPKVSTEGSTVTLKGFDFTLGSADKVEVRLGSIGKTPAFDVSANSLSFGAPAICSDPCEVQILSGNYVSNIVRIKFERGPISQPDIKAITDLNGIVGPASPGKIMTLYGINGCSFVTEVPIVSSTPVVINGVLRDDSPNGCKVLVDGTPVGLYFAWTGPNGSSQLNFLVPYGITEGNHELTLQKTEIRNGTTSVIASSKAFVFKVESVNPTFFKPYDYDITLSAPPYAENGQPVYVSPTHPAHPGDVLVAYLSGGGKTSPMLPERNAGTAQFLQTVEIWINNVPCTVLYAGTQNQYPGLEQLNFQIPQEVSSEGGMATLKIKVGNSMKEFNIHFEK